MQALFANIFNYFAKIDKKYTNDEIIETLKSMNLKDNQEQWFKEN